MPSATVLFIIHEDMTTDYPLSLKLPQPVHHTRAALMCSDMSPLPSKPDTKPLLTSDSKLTFDLEF